METPVVELAVLSGLLLFELIAMVPIATKTLTPRAKIIPPIAPMAP